MKICLRGTMKFINSPFAIIDKIMKVVDYQKGILYMRTFLEEKEIIYALLMNLSNKSLDIAGLNKLAH